MSKICLVTVDGLFQPIVTQKKPVSIRTYAKKPGFYGKFIILSNGVYEETGFLGSECVSPVYEK
jgi:hypothetical protein